MTRRSRNDDPKYVCAKCGSRRIDVEFTAHGTGSAEIMVDSKGRPYVAHVDTLHTEDVEHDSFQCADCSASWWPLEKGIKPEHLAGIDLQPGDLVWLPDGLKGTVATVDAENNTFTVVGWHETFKAGEGTPVVGPFLTVAT